MNITQASGTTTSLPSQEISLRTMISDVKSLERGNQAPIAEHIQVKSSEPIQQDTVKVPRGSISVFRLILAIIFLICVGVGMYYYVYPYVADYF